MFRVLGGVVMSELTSDVVMIVTLSHRRYEESRKKEGRTLSCQSDIRLLVLCIDGAEGLGVLYL